MRSTWLVLGLLVVLSCATPASACEKCTMWFDSQALKWCKDCVYSYCGYFMCSIEEDSDGWQTCGSAWDADGDDQCFTEEGMMKNQCGPEEKDPVGALTVPSSELSS